MIRAWIVGLPLVLAACGHRPPVTKESILADPPKQQYYSAAAGAQLYDLNLCVMTLRGAVANQTPAVSVTNPDWVRDPSAEPDSSLRTSDFYKYAWKIPARCRSLAQFRNAVQAHRADRAFAQEVSALDECDSKRFDALVAAGDGDLKRYRDTEVANALGELETCLSDAKKSIVSGGLSYTEMPSFR